MIDYIETIIIPYVESYREFLINPDQATLVIMDNFKNQVTSTVNNLLEVHNIYVYLILLQPIDVAVNKLGKDFLKRRFEQWYSGEVTKQLQGAADIASVELQPIDQFHARPKECCSV